MPTKPGEVQTASDTPLILANVSFWSDMAANAAGDVVTAVILGVWATRFAAAQQMRANEDRLADLEEDNRRWFRDRDAELQRELRRLAQQGAKMGNLSAGIASLSQEAAKRWVLLDYRNEMTLKRRRYANLRPVESWPHRLLRARLGSLRRFELTAVQRETLAAWRTVSVTGVEPRAVSDDPTSEALEPGLRRFEGEGRSTVVTHVSSQSDVIGSSGQRTPY